MATKRKGLGRGLETLLGQQSSLLAEVQAQNADISSQTQAAPEKNPHEKVYQEVAVELVQASRYQPRRDFDDTALVELTESIKAQGIIQPIVVRERAGSDGYEIIAGERRFRAALRAEFKKVPVFIRQIDDQAALAMALVENLQREDLNPIEEALALQRLTQEFSLTHQALSDVVGKSRTSVTNSLRLLTLAHEAKELLENRVLEVGHAKVLLSLPAELQAKVARVVADKSLSVRETEELVKQYMLSDYQDEEKVVSFKTAVDPNIRSLQNSLSEKLGAVVEIRHQGNRGNGTLVIKYNSLDELDGILAHIK